MLNNAWPGMIWHLYDWYLRPGGSYFGTKKACEPLHVQYSYDDRSIVVVNSYYRPYSKLTVTAKVYSFELSERFVKTVTVDVGADSSTRVFELPDLKGLSSTYFVSLSLEDGGSVVSRNFYWLSTKAETLDWENSTWYHTPTNHFADYGALNRLANVDLNVAVRSETQGAQGVTTVTLVNPSRTLAFAVHLKVKRRPVAVQSGIRPVEEEVLPVIWQDNYFALLPGEKRQVTATYDTRNAGEGQPLVEVDGWNMKSKVVQH